MTEAGDSVGCRPAALVAFPFPYNGEEDDVRREQFDDCFDEFEIGFMHDHLTP